MPWEGLSPIQAPLIRSPSLSKSLALGTDEAKDRIGRATAVTQPSPYAFPGGSTVHSAHSHNAAKLPSLPWCKRRSFLSYSLCYRAQRNCMRRRPTVLVSWG